MSEKSDHWHVGRDHAFAGEPRYKFQDKHLQKEYDDGYNSFREFEEIVMSEQSYRLCLACGNKYHNRYIRCTNCGR